MFLLNAPMVFAGIAVIATTLASRAQSTNSTSTFSELVVCATAPEEEKTDGVYGEPEWFFASVIVTTPVAL